jgi:hypothetical protein
VTTAKDDGRKRPIFGTFRNGGVLPKVTDAVRAGFAITMGFAGNGIDFFVEVLANFELEPGTNPP